MLTAAQGAAPSASGPRLQDGARGHRFEAKGLALPIWPFARLAQEQEPDMRGGEAGGGGRLEAMTKGGQEPHPEGQNINDRPSEEVAIALTCCCCWTTGRICSVTDPGEPPIAREPVNLS
jgi:hypothetical protein